MRRPSNNEESKDTADPMITAPIDPPEGIYDDHDKTHKSSFQIEVEDAEVVTILLVADAALLKTLVVRERGTVMDGMMEASMMAMKGVQETLYVGAITA